MAQNFSFRQSYFSTYNSKEREKSCDVIIQCLHNKTTRVHEYRVCCEYSYTCMQVCVEYDMHVCVLHVDVVDVMLGLIRIRFVNASSLTSSHIVDRNRPLEGPPLKSHKHSFDIVHWANNFWCYPPSQIHLNQIRFFFHTECLLGART